MSKLLWKPGAMISPLPPVLITSGTLENPNVMTAAWTGVVNTDPPMTFVSIKPSRHTHGLVEKGREFCINLTTEDLVNAADYCGVRSGAKVDKFKACRITAAKASLVNAPIVSESPVNIECRVRDIVRLGSHDMFLADIVAVQVDTKLVDAAGRLDLGAAKLIAYAHGTYYALGKALGTFGFSVRKRKTLRTIKPNNKK